MTDPLTAAISFFALGATLLGAAVLLLFNPRSRGVRWFTVFNVGLMGWLLGQGMRALSGPGLPWDAVHAFSVTLLPAFFVAFALIEEAGRPTRDGLLVLGAAVLLLPVLLPELVPVGGRSYSPALMTAWQLAGWIGGGLLVAPLRLRKAHSPAARRDALVIASFLSFVPVSIAAAFVLGGDAFFFRVLPLLVVGVQFLIFLGVLRLRFYDIEVRAARTGELAAEAAEAERLAVLGELAASVAHEVRNPLTGVRSLAQRLADDDVDPERRRRYARVILDESARVDRIVGNLLDLSRRSPKPARLEAVALEPLFEDLLLLTGSRARRSEVAVAASAGDLVAGGAVREHLAQALLNLLLNAIAHSPRGGRVELLAREAGDGVEIVVRDQGPGISPDDRDRIFEPFQSATADGTGLGLSVVRRLCREHGWDVSVHDAPGGGGEFRLMVPAGASGLAAGD